MIRTFTTSIEPRGQGRPRFRTIQCKNGAGAVATYKAREDVAYEKAVRDAYLLEHGGQKPLEGPLTVAVTALLPIPKSETIARKKLMHDDLIRPTKKPDIDNIVKAVLDALNGVAWVDDKQICELTAAKRYADSNDTGLVVSIITTGSEAQDEG